MISNKKTLKVSLIMAFVAIMAVVIFLSLSVTAPIAFAEEKEFIEKTSLLADIYADKRDIGDARISTYIHLKPSGDGLFMVEGEIQPKINDGSNDYQVRWFTLGIKLFDSFGSMSTFTEKDNSTEKIKTEGTGSSLTVTNDNVSFNISHSSSMTASTSSVNANYSHLEGIKGEREIDKSIYIQPLKSTKDTTYSFTAVFFFKFNPASTNTYNYEVVMNKIRVDGIMFAPDYGTNNSEALKITGRANLAGSRNSSGSIVNIGSDGSPNDWLANGKFDYIVK